MLKSSRVSSGQSTRGTKALICFVIVWMSIDKSLDFLFFLIKYKLLTFEYKNSANNVADVINICDTFDTALFVIADVGACAKLLLSPSLI